jgi:predicted flavoprotein YhiN
VATDSLERAISSAGGVRLDELEGCRIARLTNVYVAGEMVDWEAPTGGYLLQGCFSTGAAAARQIIAALDGSRFAGER